MAARSGPSSGAQIVGLKELRRELKALHPRWPQALTAIHKKIATEVAIKAQSRARSLGGVYAKAAPGIKGYGTTTNARVGVLAGKRTPMANAAFWGAKRRTGWNARNTDSAPQFPAWVGNTWEAGVRGQGPYAINPTIAAETDRIVEQYGDMVEDLVAKAFPD